MTTQLQRDAHRVLSYLQNAGGTVNVELLAQSVEIDQSKVMAICTGFVEKQWVEICEQSLVELSFAQEGETWLKSGQPLIERIAAEKLCAEPDRAWQLPQLAQELSISTQEMGKTLRMLLTKSYAKKQGNALLWGGADLQKTTDDEQILSRIASADGLLRITEEESESPQISEALKILRSRNYIKTKSRKQRSIMLTAIGQQILDQGVEVIEQVNQLTEAMLLSGSWREASFRPYDVQLETAPLYPGKAHPLRRVLEETRRAFLNMGFTEIRGPYTESAFWDFDALFQPQDHPAREMQDTFYCKRPDTFALPQRELVEVIRKTHEDGGSTGSTGWRYCWSEDKARRVVLRTHTTAVTVSACHLDSHPPQKVFTVGRVFRRESIDYKHLPEFHQVDGVIIDTHASFASLLGTLREFYFQMGFSEVKFRPDFFPYTEPSVGVFVRIPGHNEWLELGGAGVFRPEVVLPAGVDVPVLAWGLGLERLAMIRYNIRDIRQLYLSHLDWLQQSALAK